jgi:serine/threonine protein phosphatase PrpC
MTNQDATDFINDLLLNKKFTGNYAKELAELAYSKGSLDNITTLVYLLK